LSENTGVAATVWRETSKPAKRGNRKTRIPVLEARKRDREFKWSL